MVKLRLKQLREERNINQRDLAQLMHVSHTTISNYECNKKSPDYDKLIWLCNYFNVCMEYMLGVSDIPLQYNYSPPKSIGEDEKQTLSFYCRLNEENKILIKGKMIELYKEQSSDKKTVKKTNIG